MGKIMRRGVDFSGGSWSGSEVSLVPITNGYLDITETVTIPDYMDYDEIIILMKSTGTGWGWEISLYPKHEVAIGDSYHSACTGIYLNETLNVYLFANLNIETHVLSITQQKPESDAYAANKYTVIGRKRSYVSGGSSNSAENIKYDETKNVKEVIDEVNSNLIASDNTPFRFGVDADGNYGYIITDSEGADTVILFSNVKKLYEALQYSGLVTEDMTFDEMCAVLAEYFPYFYYDYVKDYYNSFIASYSGETSYFSKTSSTGKIEIQFIATSDGEITHSGACRSITMTNTTSSPKTLTGTLYYSASYGGSGSAYLRIGIIDTTTNETTYVVSKNGNTSGTQSISYQIPSGHTAVIEMYNSVLFGTNVMRFTSLILS